MAEQSVQPILTAVFVDYDNIYLSLKRRSEDAAKRFAKDATSWIKEIESGLLMTATNSPATTRPRRIVLNRCYGNPVPRRNAHDNSTDMNSFPFVRHHFLRAGFEVIDCPPLTAQLKNSSDIRMVMDVRDFLNHETRFEEFVILSGDADFTPVLHRLRAHARRTVIFANDYTAQPYTAICDGEVRESHLLGILLEGKSAQAAEGKAEAKSADAAAQTQPQAQAQPAPTAPAQPVETASEARAPIKLEIPAEAPSLEPLRLESLATVSAAIRSAGGPVPLEALAERTTRALGQDRTTGTGWAGAGSFIELLRGGLPEDLLLTDQPPYLAYESRRGPAQARPATDRQQQPAAFAKSQQAATPPSQPAMQAPQPIPQPQIAQPQIAQPQIAQPQIAQPQIAQPRVAQQQAPQPPIMQPPIMQPPITQPQIAQPQVAAAIPQPALPPLQRGEPIPLAAPPQPARPAATRAPQPQQQPAPAARQADMATAIQQSIARIHDACQAPPLSPPEYRALFDLMAREITEGGLQGELTLNNINVRAQEVGISLSRDDVRFVMEVVSQADPWFEQGASANLFAGRFRNFVVARCRSQGLNLSSDEIDLIEAWFTGSSPAAPQNIRVPAAPNGAQQNGGQGDIWGAGNPSGASYEQTSEEFPKILRTRLRG